MFTNWLTGPPSSGGGGGGMGVTLPANIVATPPDVILEVGPAPSTRFMAHSILLAMHSGYLRSAIRLDENGVQNTELAIFLTNVTPEQFAPLLTYMYTGYLDLNIENIFGVLLATHVLHMPRALEICRAFLSRTQSEGYLNNTFFSQHINESNNNNSSTNVSKSNGVKVIRPIASKAAIPNLGFIVPPMPHISLPSTGTPFRSLNNNHKDISKYHHSKIIENHEDSPPPQPQLQTPQSPLQLSLPPHRQSDLIKSSSSIVVAKKSSKLKKSSSTNEKTRRSTTTNSDNNNSTTNSNNSNHHRKETAAAAAAATVENENKIIIDVASCDGPVRFRRVLNDAYGRQPQSVDNLHNTPPSPPHQERSHQSVSNSFHQQMAKTISQRQQSEEVENNEDLKHRQQQSQQLQQQQQQQQSTNGSAAGEIYNCVYCKHTFKSQYCYQKHAKRHLNPLSLDCTSDVNSVVSSGGGSSDNDKDEQQRLPPPPPPPAPSNQQLIIDGKREVRPLDMNVQYYPCKTCGSKFPSYYFVHKHRKMCHANEESGGGGGGQ